MPAQAVRQELFGGRGRRWLAVPVLPGCMTDAALPRCSGGDVLGLRPQGCLWDALERVFWRLVLLAMASPASGRAFAGFSGVVSGPVPMPLQVGLLAEAYASGAGMPGCPSMAWRAFATRLPLGERFRLGLLMTCSGMGQSRVLSVVPGHALL